VKVKVKCDIVRSNICATGNSVVISRWHAKINRKIHIFSFQPFFF